MSEEAVESELRKVVLDLQMPNGEHIFYQNRGRAKLQHSHPISCFTSEIRLGV